MKLFEIILIAGTSLLTAQANDQVKESLEAFSARANEPALLPDHADDDKQP